MTDDRPGVLVLHEAVGDDAPPDAADTLVQADQVGAALAECGWTVARLATDLDLGALRRILLEKQPRFVFNLFESLPGQGCLVHVVPAVLEAERMAFTGSRADAILLSSHKRLAKDWMQLHGIAVPEAFEPVEPRDDNAQWIVKSLWEHASYGMDDSCVVVGARAAQARLSESEARFGGGWFAERFIDGREFNISILEKDGEPAVLPLAEMTFVDYPAGKPKIVGYAAKWSSDAQEYSATQRVFPALPAREQSMLESLALRCWEIFGLGGYARVDVRLASDGTPYVLEVNANPCLAPDAGYVAAALQADLPYVDLIRLIVDSALRRTR